MIPLVLQPEPPGFDQNVRQKGSSFLQKNPSPTSEEFKPHQYWKLSAKELYEGYKKICAYSCVYLPTPNGTIDHFLPKSSHPNQAYEWNNLRLAQYKMNFYKDSSLEVIDPASVQFGWFVLDFPSCLVKAGEDIDQEIKQKVESTIKILKLNEDDSLVQERCDLMVAFAHSDVSLKFLERRYPFLATEIVRQGIQTNAINIFKKLD